MIFWAVALLVWVAAGARLGRVVARTATPLRMSMVFAGFSVALSSTVMVPAVWDIVDRIAPEQHAAAMIVIVLWTALSAASAVGAVSAWPVMSRPAMRGLATVLYSVGLLVAIAVLFGYPRRRSSLSSLHCPLSFRRGYGTSRGRHWGVESR